MNPLDQIIEWYETTLDSLSTTAYFLDKSPSSFPLKSAFATKPIQEAKETISLARDELHDLTVVALMASCEQLVVDYLTSNIQSGAAGSTGTFEQNITEKLIHSAERWRFDDILDLFKPPVDSHIIGQVKQVYEYRSWVAHGKRGKSPAKLTPRKAYERLVKFLTSAKIP